MRPKKNITCQNTMAALLQEILSLHLKRGLQDFDNVVVRFWIPKYLTLTV